MREHQAADDEAGEGTAQPDPPPAAEEATSPTPAADPPTQSTPPSEPEPYVIQVDWRDLVHRQAGQAVREQADAARQAAPIKILAARVLGVHTNERAWRIGAKGEERCLALIVNTPAGPTVRWSMSARRSPTGMA